MNERTQACALTQTRPGFFADVLSQSNVMHAEVEMNTLDDTPKGKVELDGVTHINIDKKGHTELGQMLTHMARSQFDHPEFGPFQSVEGFIGFIRSGAKDDQFHYVHGMNARYRAKNQDSDFIRGFREIVMEANYLKIVQNESLLKAFRDSTLPFDHYYCLANNGRPVQPRNAQWIIPGFEELRRLIKAGEPYPKVDYSGVAEIGAE
jgi:hypothetical protein